MASILDKIIQTKRQEVEQAKAARSLAELRADIAALPPPRNFFQAVTQPPRGLLNLIAEVKKASPSAGVIRPDFDAVRIATTYQSAGADALSVLTDTPWFQGSLDDLRAVKQAVAIPILRKDFIIDPYQVYQSRAAGADAILLIAECLDTSQMIDLQILATEQNLTCLIEVHDMENLIRVRDHVIGFPHRGYSLLGINNRDLTTFITDLGTTLRLAELVEDKRVLISESGLRSRRDAEKLAAVGVNTVLVGETLMRSDDPAATISELFG